MKLKDRTYSITDLVSAVLMVVTLLWLTVSTPFVNAYQQEHVTHTQANSQDEDFADTEEAPIGNTTEEKTETNTSNFSEYLHHIEELSQLSGSLEKHNCSHNFPVYVAFHGEMLCPPPNLTL